MPSKCGKVGCEKMGSMRGRVPGLERNLYFCCTAHREAAGALQTDKKRRDPDDIMIMSRNNGSTYGEHVLACIDESNASRASLQRDAEPRILPRHATLRLRSLF